MKKVALAILLILIGYLAYHHQAVSYGISQGYGQFKVLNGAISIEEFLQTNPSKEQIEKIELIQDVKLYAENSLGLKTTDSYQKVYDQKGKAILWMVTASPEFELKAHQWSFPIAGSFEYKGFFELEKARLEKEFMEEQGYDVEIDEVSAWSTLGFFSDPILTSMLEKDSGRLAELIIHELSHASIYLRDSVELNENFASFVGRKGAEMYLRSIGDTSSIQQMYAKKDRRKKAGEIIREGSRLLDSLYNSFKPEDELDFKRRAKKKLIDGIRWQVAETWSNGNLSKAQKYFSEFNPNNAFFTGYLTYRSKSDHFEEELENKFNGNLVSFIEYYIEEHGN